MWNIAQPAEDASPGNSAGAAAKRTVRTVLGFMANRDYAALLDSFTEDAVIRVLGAPHVPFVGSFNTQDLRRYFFTDAMLAGSPEKVQLRNFIAEGDHVIVLGYFDFLVHATGRHYYGDFALHLLIRDGLVASWQMYEDSWRVATAFDIDPSQAKIGVDKT
jgi:uncharacterized protein